MADKYLSWTQSLIWDGSAVDPVGCVLALNIRQSTSYKENNVPTKQDEVTQPNKNFTAIFK